MSGGASAAAPGPERDNGAPDAATEQASDAASLATPPREDIARRPPPPATGATPADFLITSEERDAAEMRLRQAVADEALSLEEFGDRMRVLLAARTRGDLDAAVAGLPAAAPPHAPPPRRGDLRPARTGGSAIAILGNAETRGRWRPDASTTALAVLGGSVIDLQGVEFEGDVLVINAIATLGEIEIIVPEGMAVDLRGISVLGERRVEIDGTVAPGAPVVRVDGLALLGQVTVRHPRPSERYEPEAARGGADRARSVGSSPALRAAGRGTRPAVRRWAAGVLAAVLLALPIGWTLTADEVVGAVFGSASETVSAAQIVPGDAYSVGAPVAFGSVEIRVPEGVNVERDGAVIFGSTNCEPCGADVPGAPTVQVRSAGAFGSVNVVRIPQGGTR